MTPFQPRVTSVAAGVLAIAGALVAADGQRPSGLDPASFDLAVRPQDDLYRYVNGAWLDRTAIPDTRVVYTAATELQERVEQRLRVIIEEIAAVPAKPPGSPEQQIGDLYTSMIDVARRASTSVFTVALSEGTVRSPQEPAHERLFAQLADTTGGALDILQRDEDISGTFAQAFEDFRTSYVLSYTYDGPPRPGWHPVQVRVTRPGTYEVRARQGYFSAE